MIQNIIRIPISCWIEAQKALSEGDSFTGVTLEPIYVVSSEQMLRLIQHEIPFERVTPEELQAVQNDERRLSHAERHAKSERFFQEALETRRQHASVAQSSRV